MLIPFLFYKLKMAEAAGFEPATPTPPMFRFCSVKVLSEHSFRGYKPNEKCVSNCF